MTRVFNEECERLLQGNSSSVTRVALVDLPGWFRPGTERLGEALRGNTHVEALSLNLSRIEEAEDINLLLQFIVESTILQKLFLFGALARSAARTAQFLQAAGRNSAITEIELRYSSIPVESFSTMMRMTASIGNLSLERVSFTQETIRPDAASVDDQLAGAFGSNRTLRRLDLDTLTSEVFSQVVVRSLSQHLNLQDLHIDGMTAPRRLGQTVSGALANLFRSCGSNLQNVTFENFNWADGTFETIATSLQQNVTVNVISLRSCRFDDPSAQSFRPIF